MSAPEAIADGLAFAFLAGPWHRAGLRERAELVLGARPPWLVPLIWRVLAHFALPPHDASDLLCHVIQRAPAFRRGLARGRPSARLDTLLISPPRMAESRWPVPALPTTVDLAFSGDAQLSRQAPGLLTLAAGIALDEGFRINHHKTRLMTQSQPQRLVGLVTNQRANVPRAERDRLEAILTNALRHGLESQNRDEDPRFLESLRGRVAWVEQVNSAHARKLRQLLLSIPSATP